MPNVDQRDRARGIAQDQRRRLQSPAARPLAPRHVVTMPLLSAMHAERLGPSVRTLYLHLWMAGRQICNGAPLPPWFYHTDAQLRTETDLSPRTLARARDELRTRGLIYTTTNQGADRPTPTWYLLLHPVEIPHPSPPEADVYADELAHTGPPPDPATAWAALPHPAHPGLTQLARALLASRNDQVRRASILRQLQEADPWTYTQLRWAMPDLYPGRSADPRQTRLGL